MYNGIVKIVEFISTLLIIMIKQTLLAGILSLMFLTHASALIDVSPTAIQYDTKTAEATSIKTVAKSQAITQGSTLPMSVSSTEDINAYIAQILKGESSILAIDAESNTKAISVTWKNPGRFLGMFSVNVNSKTTVEAVNSTTTVITTTIPWWAFFVTDVANTAAVTDTALKESIEIKNNMRVDTNAQAKAYVIHAIVVLVSAVANAAASVK